MPSGDFALKVPQIKEAADLYLNQHWSLTELANKYGVSRDAVTNGLAWMGIKPRKPLEGRLVYIKRHGCMQALR